MPLDSSHDRTAQEIDPAPDIEGVERCRAAVEQVERIESVQCASQMARPLGPALTVTIR
jgi:hypothetical protein